MKTETIKSYLKILLSLINLKTTVFVTSFENKTLSEELQDYKVKSIKGYKIISVWKGSVTRLQSLSEGEGERAILD